MRLWVCAVRLCVLVPCALAPGCQRDPSSRDLATGHERQDCRPDKTCDPGLVCLSNLCVRPPPADCQAVAEVLASLDLGNYAEPETRAPVVAKYRSACDAALVSRDEASCIDKARSAALASECAPRMFSGQVGITRSTATPGRRP